MLIWLCHLELHLLVPGVTEQPFRWVMHGGIFNSEHDGEFKTVVDNNLDLLHGSAPSLGVPHPSVQV